MKETQRKQPTEAENGFMTVVKMSSPCSTKEVYSTKIALEPMYLLTISKVLVCIIMYLDVGGSLLRSL